MHVGIRLNIYLANPSPGYLIVHLSQLFLTFRRRKTSTVLGKAELGLVVVDFLFEFGSGFGRHRFGHQLLSLLLGEEPSGNVTVFFCRQQGLQVNTGPLLFSGQLFLLRNTLVVSVVTVANETGDTPEIDKGSETSGWKISLPLNGLVASDRW